MFEAGAHHAFEVGVAEIIGLYGADVFVSQIDARDAFVVGGQSDGDAEQSVERKGMIHAADAEDYIVAGEADFQHDMFCSHLLQESVRLILVHDVDAVADAFGVSDFHGQADVAAEAFVGNEPRRKLPGVQTDVDLGIDRVKKADDVHVQGVIGHGGVAVLWHDEVDADESRIGHGGFKAEQGLGEDLLLREAAEDLAEETDLDAARGSGIGAITMFEPCAKSFRVAEGVLGESYLIA